MTVLLDDTGAAPHRGSSPAPRTTTPAADPRRVAGARGARYTGQCATTVRQQLELGADAVILHGATPTELAPIVEAYAG